MSGKMLLPCAFLLQFALPAVASPEAEAQKSAEAFYAASMSVHSIHIAGIPPAKVRATLSPYITAELERLLAEGDRIEEAHTKKTNNQEPPFLEGDIFSSNFEGVSTYRITACAMQGTAAVCPVALTYEDPRDKKGPSWTDKLWLKQVNGQWRVDDIEYGATWEFANRGKLSDMLKALIKEEAELLK